MFTFISYKFICIFFLLSFITIHVYHTSPTSAVCFLTRQPYSEILQFALELAESLTSLDVFVIVDDNNVITLPTVSSKLQYLQFNESKCIKYGFQGANVFGSSKNCSAWDKAIYYFSRQVTHHNFVWFIEEDVFIPSIQAFVSLHELYSTSYDLVTGDINYNMDGNLATWYHWYLTPGSFVLPWAHGMVCSVGCSRRLLSAIDEYVKWRGHLTFLETLFHTLAIQENTMKIVTPFELDTIRYRDTYTLKHIQARPYNWWHPVKNIEQQREWRKQLANNSLVNKIDFLNILNSVKRQLQANSSEISIVDIETQISNITAPFEIVKGQINASNRRELRNQFLRLITNRSTRVTSTALTLADHAFRLSIDLPNRIIIKNRTTIHVKLEETIDYYKRKILQLMNKNSQVHDQIFLIDQLRNQTTQLIRTLRVEMRCELNIVQCDPERKWVEINYNSSLNLNSHLNYLHQSVFILLLFFIILFCRHKKCNQIY